MVSNKMDKGNTSVHTVTPDLLLTPSISSTKAKGR